MAVLSLEELTPAWAPAPDWACGVDLGVRRWLTFDNGWWVEPPRVWAGYEKAMRKLQQHGGRTGLQRACEERTEPRGAQCLSGTASTSSEVQDPVDGKNPRRSRHVVAQLEALQRVRRGEAEAQALAESLALHRMRAGPRPRHQHRDEHPRRDVPTTRMAQRRACVTDTSSEK